MTDDTLRQECVEFVSRLIRETYCTEDTMKLVLAFARAQRAKGEKINQAKGLRDAAKIVCSSCLKGYPLQKNGGWHNDMDGKDTLVDNCCDAVGILAQATAREQEGA
jgi:hypothetical protein